MHKKVSHYLLSISILLVSFTSCINLQHINNFAASSVQTLSAQSDIGYSFSQHCLDFECGKGIYHVPDIKTDFSKKAACNCDTFKMADKALNLFNSVLTGYLTGVAELSDGNAVNYKYDDVIKAVDVTAIKTVLPVTSDQIASVGKLATIITNDLMDVYRKRKLKNIIQKAAPDFDIVITAYIKCMTVFFKNTILDNDLNVSLPNLYSDYFVTNNNSLSPYEKSKIYEEYLAKKATYENYVALTENFIEGLNEIKEAHKKLNEESNQLTSKQLKELISLYATDIQSIAAEFKQLKNTSKQ